ncbi:MAG: hypothetical protein M3518_02600 [Actinomycetota bacterium]|nr:hypothetical protein [Actinomycetota bacterium]
MLNPEDLGKLARALDMTSEEELACDECFEELDRFVEMELAGLDAAAAMPLVQDHLDKCGDCREEYQALLRALRAEQGWTPVRLIWARLRRFFRADRGPD